MKKPQKRGALARQRSREVMGGAEDFGAAQAASATEAIAVPATVSAASLPLRSLVSDLSQVGRCVRHPLLTHPLVSCSSGR